MLPPFFWLVSNVLITLQRPKLAMAVVLYWAITERVMNRVCKIIMANVTKRERIATIGRFATFPVPNISRFRVVCPVARKVRSLKRLDLQ
tara:strand:- start:1833 stop:2102 length:270 start_codon:yes stop_codon:yes gene_type:complete